MTEWIKEVWFGECHSCRFRHSCARPLPEKNSLCPHWKLGDCYLCQYIEVPDDEWFKRGCETWCFGGCEKFKRDWRRTFDWIKYKIFGDKINEEDI